MKPTPISPKALLALVSSLVLTLVGVPVALHQLGADGTDRAVTPDVLAAGNAPSGTGSRPPRRC